MTRKELLAKFPKGNQQRQIVFSIIKYGRIFNYQPAVTYPAILSPGKIISRIRKKIFPFDLEIPALDQGDNKLFAYPIRPIGSKSETFTLRKPKTTKGELKCQK
jgi:hypothetical protein